MYAAMWKAQAQEEEEKENKPKPDDIVITAG